MTDALGAYATSYELDAALKLDVEDMITMLTPHDAPLLGTFNGNQNGPQPPVLTPGEDVYEVQYDWQDDELQIPRSTVGSAYTAAGGTIEVAAGDGAKFQADDLIEVVATDGSTATYLVDSVNYGSLRSATRSPASGPSRLRVVTLSRRGRPTGPAGSTTRRSSGPCPSS